MDPPTFTVLGEKNPTSELFLPYLELETTFKFIKRKMKFENCLVDQGFTGQLSLPFETFQKFFGSEAEMRKMCLVEETALANNQKIEGFRLRDTFQLVIRSNDGKAISGPLFEVSAMPGGDLVIGVLAMEILGLSFSPDMKFIGYYTPKPKLSALRSNPKGKCVEIIEIKD